MQHGGTNPSRMLLHTQTLAHTHSLSLLSLCIASGDECLADDFEYSTAHCYTVRVLSLLSQRAYLDLVRM